MRLLLLLFLFPLSCPVLLFAQETAPGSEALAKPPGILKLADGSELRGRPEGLDAGGKLSWKLGFQDAPVSIPLTHLVEMRLPGNSGADQPGTHQARVHLTNGDLLLGQLAGLSDTHLEVKTSYGGSLNLKRTMVSTIEVMATGKLLYNGPVDFESWTQTGENGAWKLENGALVSSKGGGVAREFETPAKCQFGFDLHWSKSLRFRVLFLADDGTTLHPDNCYDLVCQRRFVYLRKRWMAAGSGGSRILGQVGIESLAEKGTTRFDFYFDREGGSIALYVNGSQAAVWEDRDVKEGAFGNWFHLVSEEFYPLQVSRIRLAPWDGDLPEDALPDAQALDAQAPDANGKEDVVQLLNRDVVSGELKAINEGRLQIHSNAQDVEFPIEKVRAIRLGRGEYEEPIRKKGDIRAFTADGGRVTFRLDSFSPETLKGYSGTFGDAELQLDAFSLLEFNIYNGELRGRPE